jgi:2-oxoglutarate dehydrogenase complex dehydrogenase (E1) component-like enzyme
VLWEAQFGDFVNGAQIIVDQFISAAEDKWGQRSSLVLLLPHGFEGQGPEHSSARLERFLDLAAEDNMQVAYPSTPAQYFHLLRRQALRANRKPLIVMTPKSLLRLAAARSTAEQLTGGQFHEVLPDPEKPSADQVTRVLLCSGKVYYELAKRRSDRALGQVALLRVEQLYPFPAQALRSQLDAYPNARQRLWVQEEPENMGAWRYMRLKAEQVLGVGLEPVCRDEGAAPAAGSPTLHQQEQQELLDRAFAGL